MTPGAARDSRRHYALHQYISQEKTLSDLDAASMTGIYLLLLYFLFTANG